MDDNTAIGYQALLNKRSLIPKARRSLASWPKKSRT
jgi:hypothetical protein